MCVFYCYLKPLIDRFLLVIAVRRRRDWCWCGQSGEYQTCSEHACLQTGADEPVRYHFSLQVFNYWEHSVSPSVSWCSGVFFCCCSAIGDRAFPVASFRLWNTAAERHVGVVSVCFMKRLKAHLFSQSFPQISCSAYAVTLSLKTL